MTDIVDIVVHIDETLQPARLEEIEAKLRNLDGVISIFHQENKLHLMVVKFNLAKLHAQDILAHVKAQGVHAELSGL